MMNRPVSVNRWTYRLALTAAVATFLMIVVGGLVTTTESGDAEPEWSLRFWEWFKHPDDLPGGLLYELGHRMLGTVVGFLTLGMAAMLWFTPSSRTLRWLGVAAIIGVIAQGGLGGLRVKAESSEEVQLWLLNVTGAESMDGIMLAIKMIHATVAQSFFCLIVAIALMTSPGWQSDAPPVASPDTKTIRKRSRMTVALVFLQLILGAYVRHTHLMLGVMIHMVFAFGVMAAILALASCVLGRPEHGSALRTPAGGLVGATFLQPLLGFIAWMMLPTDSYDIPGTEAILIRTGHVALGALIFAGCVVLALRSHSLLTPKLRSSTPVTAVGVEQGAQG